MAARILICEIFLYVIVTSVLVHSEYLDLLQPYTLNHGSILKHRQIRDCQPIKYGSKTHQLYPGHDDPIEEGNLIETKYFTLNLGADKWVKGHYSLIKNPLLTLSVLEPRKRGGCKERIRETVVESAKQRNCLVAMNAGFFNTTNGKCLGNIISDGVKIQDSNGIQNAQFGIMKNGSIFTGYLSEDDFKREAYNFKQLVSGVVWLLRDNDTYIYESQKAECPDTQETGSFKKFVDVTSARTSVGHDKEGRVILLHVDGKTGSSGVDLLELAMIMQHFGAINAINTDGGGSATFAINGIVVNYPSDNCGHTELNCARPVSTVLCAHEPDCSKGCGLHGICHYGECKCQKPWSGSDCLILPCHLYNCTSRGVCTVYGCRCDWGYTGENCEKECTSNFWGPNCEIQCQCINNASCNPANGSCLCLPGFTGRYCEKMCAVGRYGENCSLKCNCSNPCNCDSVTGSCNSSNENTECLLNLHKKQHLVTDYEGQYRILIIVVITTCVLAGIIIVGTILILWSRCKACVSCQRSEVVSYHKPFADTSDMSDDEDQL